MILSFVLNLSILPVLGFLFWGFLTFFVGLFIGRTLQKQKSVKVVEVPKYKDLGINDNTRKLRAIKTFDRGGVQINKDYNYKIRSLDFNRIGKSSFENRDNLQKIKGIGPCLEESLNEIGIFTFHQISNFNADDIKATAHLIKSFPGNIEKNDWIKQAIQLKNRHENIELFQQKMTLVSSN